MNELQILNINGIECYEKDGTAYLKLETVARGLGFTKTDRKNGVDYTRIHKQNLQKWLFDFGLIKSEKDELPEYIPEQVFYLLSMKAENENGRAFQHTVAYEVIPSIRKHGAYMTPETLEAAILNPDTMIKLCTALKEEQDKRRALEAENTTLTAENEVQRQAIADFQPIKQYVDTILSSNGTMATSQIAADYDMSARSLNKILHEEGIQRNVNGQWILYKEYMGKGYTKSITIPITRSDGRPGTKLHTHWTQKGRLLIHEILTARGIQAVMDRQISA